jgi:hypothetical protein
MVMVCLKVDCEFQNLEIRHDQDHRCFCYFAQCHGVGATYPRGAEIERALVFGWAEA